MENQIFLAIALIILCNNLKSNAAFIATYWGQNTSEGRLTTTCATRNYQVVNIAFLSVFGDGRTPKVNLTRHCNPESNGCRNVTVGINNCQNQGVKVFLSIGGAHGSYSLTSTQDAVTVADYIWNNFLSGQSDSRPFGDGILDGVDFNIEGGLSGRGAFFYSVLARRLYEYGQRKGGRRVYLSACPRCDDKDGLNDVVLSSWIFDYVWVRFYGSGECQYDGVGKMSGFKEAWKRWTLTVPAMRFMVGLQASPTVEDGYLPPEVVVRKVLPFVKKFPNYGGIMVFDRAHDVQTNFSSIVKGFV